MWWWAACLNFAPSSIKGRAITQWVLSWLLILF
jgi:hypothetical protein